MLVEPDEKDLILWIGAFEKLERGFLRFVELVGHAAAEGQYDADGYKDVFGGEIHNFLLDFLLESSLIIPFTSCNHDFIHSEYPTVHTHQTPYNSHHTYTLS